MIKSTKGSLTIVTYIACFMFVACSSTPQQNDIANTANPQQEITQLQFDINAAIHKNIDVLASNEFAGAVKSLAEAKSDLTKQQKQSEILDDIRKGREHLMAAYKTSENRSEKAPNLFEARQFAIKARANEFPELQNDWQHLDHDVSSEAADLIHLDSKKISKLQERYMDLEKRATVQTQLGSSLALLNGLKKDGAIKLAPLTFKKAEISLSNAAQVIASSVRNPSEYQTAVATANSDAAYLNEVMKVIQQNDDHLSESAALKMVSQKSQIKALNSNLAATHAANLAETSALQTENNSLTEDINNRNQGLKAANADLEVQRVMESARAQFSPEEADAYQQGKSLVIRLKQMNFATGRTELPGTSLDLLAKISSIARSMHASQIKVEGHTDSVGKEGPNLTLSEKRANAVASYFKANGFNDVTSRGYGLQKPIATNTSKEGRAQNRRVDIILTPAESPAVQ